MGSALYEQMKARGLLIGPGVHSGPCSIFGGPGDRTAKMEEGLALWSDGDVRDNRHMISEWIEQKESRYDARGLLRRIKREAKGVALPWDYSQLPPATLRDPHFRVVLRNVKTDGETFVTAARPLDFGPDVRNVKARIDITAQVAVELQCEHGDVIQWAIPDELGNVPGWEDFETPAREVGKVLDVRERLPKAQGGSEIKKTGTGRDNVKWKLVALAAAAVAAWATGGGSALWAWLTSQGAHELIRLLGGGM